LSVLFLKMEEYLAFSLYDTNGDGLISVDEMATYLESLFLMMETTGNTPEGQQAIKIRARQAAIKCFQEADLNNDGHVNFEEFKQWYAQNLRRDNGSGLMQPGQASNGRFNLTIPDATLCYFYTVDAYGKRKYKSAGSTNSALKVQYKDTFMAYVILIQKGDQQWRVLRRYSSLKAFMKDLKRRQPSLNEPVPFPPKKLFGDLNVNRRRLALQAYFQGLFHDPSVAGSALVSQFFSETDADESDDHQVTWDQGSPMQINGYVTPDSHQSSQQSLSSPPVPPPQNTSQSGAAFVPPQHLQHHMSDFNIKTVAGGGTFAQTQTPQAQFARQNSQQLQLQRPPIQTRSEKKGMLLVVTAMQLEPSAQPLSQAYGQAILDETSRAVNGQLSRVTVQTIESTDEQSADPAAVAQVLQGTLQERGSPRITEPRALTLLSRLRASDNSGGFIPAFEIGTLLGQLGLQIKPDLSAELLKQCAEILPGESGGPSRGIDYHRFVVLLRQRAPDALAIFPARVSGGGSSFGGNAQRTSGSSAYPAVSVTLTVAGGIGQGSPTAEEDKLAREDLAFQQMIRSGFDVIKHSTKGATQKKTRRRMQCGADLSALVWRKKGLKGFLRDTATFPLDRVTQVEVVEPGSFLQGHFVWDRKIANCCFSLVASDDFYLNLEASSKAERDMFVSGFRRLAELRGQGTLRLGGNISSAERRKQENLLSAFRVFDTNGDGHITEFELGQALASLGGEYACSQSEVSQMIARADLNGDGKLDYAEFARMMSGGQDGGLSVLGAEGSAQEQALIQAFKVFDKNGDGFISKFELGQTLANLGENLSEDDISQMVAKVDANGDGLLDYNEFARMMQEAKFQ